LRRQAARSATVCADCFQPLAPAASVTIVNRRIVIPPATDWRGAPVPEHDAWLRVPICLTCWLIEMQREAAAEVGDGRLPGLRDRHVNELRALDGLARWRCAGCGRAMRRWHPPEWRRELSQNQRVCCDDCRRCMLNARARARRRVRHEPMNCAVCGRPFTPKRSDAVTCSNTCRQSLHRQRHQPAKKRGRQMSKNETAAVALALLLAATSLPSPANDQVGQGAKRPRPR
jgi:predicted nucleic acid-binding Zn ribbon protein